MNSLQKFIRSSNTVRTKSSNPIAQSRPQSLAIVVLFVLSCLVHKTIGVELIHSYQVIYLVHLLNGDYTQLYSFFRLFSFSAFDFLMVKNNLSGIASAHTQIPFRSANLELSLTLIAGISVACLFVFIALSLIWSSRQQSKENHYKQLLNLSLVSTYSFNHLLFPFVVSTLLITFVVLDSKNSQYIAVRFSYSCIFQTLLLSTIFFYESKSIFINTNRKQRLLGVKHCKRKYLSDYLLFTFAVAIVLSLSFKSKRFPIQFIHAGLYVSFLLYYIINQPYSSNFHNIGAITNALLLIYFLIWSGLKSFNFMKCQS